MEIEELLNEINSRIEEYFYSSIHGEFYSLKNYYLVQNGVFVENCVLETTIYPIYQITDLGKYLYSRYLDLDYAEFRLNEILKFNDTEFNYELGNPVIYRQYTKKYLLNNNIYYIYLFLEIEKNGEIEIVKMSNFNSSGKFTKEKYDKIKKENMDFSTSEELKNLINRFKINILNM